MTGKDLRDLLLEKLLLTGGVHRPAPVADEPDALLTGWRVYEVDLPGLDGATRHFVGYNHVTRNGRVSSPIVGFDLATRQGVTRSGRRYQLAGPPGGNGDANYVFRRWLNANRVQTEVRDVSAEYVPEVSVKDDDEKKSEAYEVPNGCTTVTHLGMNFVIPMEGLPDGLTVEDIAASFIGAGIMKIVNGKLVHVGEEPPTPKMMGITVTPGDPESDRALTDEELATDFKKLLN